MGVTILCLTMLNEFIWRLLEQNFKEAPWRRKVGLNPIALEFLCWIELSDVSQNKTQIMGERERERLKRTCNIMRIAKNVSLNKEKYFWYFIQKT